MAIIHLKAAHVPDYRFEWHPEVKRVFAFKQGGKGVPEILAFGIENHGAALNAVNIWTRGYRSARSEKPVEHLVQSAFH